MIKNKCYVYGDENLKVPVHLNYGKYMLDMFKSYKDNLAIIDTTTDKTLTFSELSQLTVDIALSLARLGVRKGDIVSICAEERIEYMATVLGIICAGATYTSTDISGKATILHRAQLVKPKILFCSQDSYKAYKEAVKSISSIEHYIIYGDEKQDGAILFKDFLTETGDVEDFVPVRVDGWSHPAIVLYSSGTTGLPKAVPLTHLNMMMDMLSIIDINYHRGKIVLTATDFYTFGLACLHAGATAAFLLTNKAKDVFEAIQKYNVNVLQQMPSTIFEMLTTSIREDYDVSSMERILSASSPLTAEMVANVNKKFPHVRDVFQLYGATEGGCICSDEIAPKGVKPGSVGCVCPGGIIKVIDTTTGEPVGPLERGEIRVHSSSVFPGYWGQTSQDHLDEEGFYKTGDIGYYDEDRYFYIVDRIKDMIKYHGFAVSPAELEEVLVSHPGVLEAGVVGAPDPQYFELPTAFVVLQAGAELNKDELTDYVNSQVAEWMPLAGGVRFVPRLPRGGRGKLDRKALRRMLQE